VTAKLQGWQDIPVFLAVYRYRTLAAAAQRLGLDTSTASRRIAALEAELDVRLFDRTRGGFTPTRAAEQVLAAAEAMEAAHARLTRDASEVEAAAEGIVRVSTAPGISSVFVAPALPKLRKAHPKLSIELDASVVPRDLTRHEADLALRSIKLSGAELVATKLATTLWVCACAPGLIKKPLARWDALPWVTWDRDLASFHVSRWLAQRVPQADVALRTSDFASQLTAAANGLGLVMAPLAYLAPTKLVPAPISLALRADAAAWPTDDLWLVGHRALRDVPRVAAVWTFLAATLRA
jgi:DNA-binding transcriptional LysR family regulator